MDLHKQIECVEKSLEILTNLRCKVFESDIVVQELTKDQKKLFKKIGVIVHIT